MKKTAANYFKMPAFYTNNYRKASNPPERQERNPITDPPQGENQNAEDREG